MKKNIIALIIIFIVVTSMTACAKPNTVVINIIEPSTTEPVTTEPATTEPTYVETVPEETIIVENRQPWLFNIRYARDGKWVETDLTTEIFGETIRIAVDPETPICVGICSDESQNFYLTETFFIVKEEFEIVEIDSDEHMGNLWWYMEAGQSAVVTMNYGTDEDPEWVSFSIETSIIT